VRKGPGATFLLSSRLAVGRVLDVWVWFLGIPRGRPEHSPRRPGGRGAVTSKQRKASPPTFPEGTQKTKQLDLEQEGCRVDTWFKEEAMAGPPGSKGGLA
ncbi:hypothetical protein H1C71_011379, partial [Ictidomys tridecemlineatus]